VGNQKTLIWANQDCFCGLQPQPDKIKNVFVGNIYSLQPQPDEINNVFVGNIYSLQPQPDEIKNVFLGQA